MQMTKYPAVILIIITVCLFTVLAASANPTNPAVATWFKDYDEIRRSAEMTKAEKLKALSIGKNEPNPENTKLASSMMQKYNAAAAAMKQLQPTAETQSLQDGYTEYFSSAGKSLSDYLEAQKTTPFSNRAFMQGKKKLSALDKTNKRIDARLRKKFKIPKHKHI